MGGLDLININTGGKWTAALGKKCYHFGFRVQMDLSIRSVLCFELVTKRELSELFLACKPFSTECSQKKRLLYFHGTGGFWLQKT